MEARAVAVHAIKVFDYWLAIGESARAVWTSIVEPFPD
jgi:hypothetical protein